MRLVDGTMIVGSSLRGNHMQRRQISGTDCRGRRGAIPPAHRPRWHPVQREYPSLVKGAWPWLASGVLAIGIGLAVWFTAFVLVPVGAVIVVVGIMRLVRSRTAASPRSN
jgi:hypothetical protein